MAKPSEAVPNHAHCFIRADFDLLSLLPHHQLITVVMRPLRISPLDIDVSDAEPKLLGSEIEEPAVVGVRRNSS